MFWIRKSITARTELTKEENLSGGYPRGFLFRELRKGKIGFTLAWTQNKCRQVLFTSMVYCNQESVVASWGQLSMKSLELDVLSAVIATCSKQWRYLVEILQHNVVSNILNLLFCKIKYLIFYLSKSTEFVCYNIYHRYLG